MGGFAFGHPRSVDWVLCTQWERELIQGGGSCHETLFGWREGDEVVPLRSQYINKDHIKC